MFMYGMKTWMVGSYQCKPAAGPVGLLTGVQSCLLFHFVGFPTGCPSCSHICIDSLLYSSAPFFCTADVIYTNSDMQPPGAAAAAARGEATPSSSRSSKASRAKQLQYFWEAFPAADGLVGASPHAISRKAGDWQSDARTTYMFTYMDAQVW
jgi:hypothetical protein